MTTMGKYNNTTGLHKWCSMCACVRVCYCGFRIESSGVVLRFSHRTCICGRMHQARNDMIFFYLLLQRLCDGCVGRWHATMWMIWNVHVNMTMCMHPSIILTGRNRQQCDGVQQTVHNTANTAMTRIKFNCIYQCKCIFAFQYTITFNWNQNYQQFIILDSVHSVCVCVTNLISVPLALCCALKMFHHHGIWHSPH